MTKPDPREAALLGLNAKIQRRDFIAGVAVAGAAAGCAPAASAVDPWNGYGGEGDYATSNGNVRATMEDSHALRDGAHADISDVIDTSEVYDVVVVGAGIAGLTAALTCRDEGVRSCLILDNHPMFGGEAKENEFLVDGHRLWGPQGSNDFGLLPPDTDAEHARLWRRLGMPDAFEFAPPPASIGALRVGRENFVPMYWNVDAADTGHFFPDGTMVRDMWRNDLANAPLSEADANDLRRFRLERAPNGPVQNRDQWLDTMTYGALLTNELGLGRAATNYIDPIVAVSAFGVSADAVSAYGAAQIRLPGAGQFDGLNPLPEAHENYLSFPGGNSGIARHLVKRLIPATIPGDSFEDIIGGRVRFAALDAPNGAVRLRLSATVLAVRHAGADGGEAEVIYLRNGRRHRVRARAVVMAIGNWVGKYLVRDLPAQQRAAFNEFLFGPVLVVNVALRNWLFLERLGISAARWFEGFGFFANIRRPMQVGPHTQPFDPRGPTVLTMYVGFPKPGLSAREQTTQSRNELLATDFAGFEVQVRRQLSDLFASAGFDAQRDIAGIILNRWGHAYVAPQPGFYFDTPAGLSHSNAARAQFGRISFGHSQLRGHQNWSGAVGEGARAAREALAVL